MKSTENLYLEYGVLILHNTSKLMLKCTFMAFQKATTEQTGNSLQQTVSQSPCLNDFR